MPRLALAVFLSCLLARGASSQTPPTDFPSEGLIRGQASMFVGALCKAAPAACPEAKRLLVDYKAAVEAARACTKEKCEPKRIKALSQELWKLDEAEHQLPFFEGREDRPLLRLSVLASARLAEAGVLAGDAKAAEAYSYRPDMQVSKIVEAICLEDVPSCSTFRGILPSDREIKAFIAGCKKEACSFEAIDPLFVRSRRSMGTYIHYNKGLPVSTLPLFSLLRETSDGLTGLIAADVQKNVAQLRTGVAAMEAHDGDAPDAKALEGLYRKSSIGTDRMAEALGWEDKGISSQRDEINVLAAKLSSLKARRKAEELAGSLGGGQGAPAAASVERALAAAERAPASPVPYRKLDVGAAPSPLNPTPSPAPAIRAEPRSKLQLLRDTFSMNPVVRTDALRRLGLTSTVGNPGRLVPLSYHQAGPMTCNVASQLQILRALDLLSDGDLGKQEKALAEEAVRRGFFHDASGTPAAYDGSIIIEKGVIVSKHLLAKWDQFEDAVTRGSLVLATVDARFLWNIKSEASLGHAILVTGAETADIDGEILGVYINDSGTDPPGAGRFVPISQFRKAWEGFTRGFVEVHR